MRINRNLYPYAAGLAVAALLLGTTGVALADRQQNDDQNGPVASSIETSRGGVRHARVCNDPKRGDDAAGCDARVVVDGNGNVKTNALPSGYGPAQFRGAYGLTSLSSTQTIAIVDAYNDPYIKSDLDKYDSTFGLPFFPNCGGSVTTSCFQKVDQRGGSRYPQTSAGWSLEIALDVEVAHGLCPTCKLILVEADSSSYTNLLAAEDRAASMGAKVISNSWGSGEFSSETSSAYDGHFSNKPGIAITFSSGDSGYGASYPAASRFVTAVGGTTLNLGPGNTYGSESAWSGAGSGCSAYEPQPSFQTLLGLSGCGNRMVADVSADADPSSGAAVYDSVRYGGMTGWFQVGGTSLASPIVAATYALAGNASTITPANGYPYSHTASLHDVANGTNGICSVAYLCNSMVGYDGPTGIGSPFGAGAF